mgnify:CR=1 FL=1
MIFLLNFPIFLKLDGMSLAIEDVIRKEVAARIAVVRGWQALGNCVLTKFPSEIWVWAQSWVSDLKVGMETNQTIGFQTGNLRGR